jgi:hypothetical protein
VPTPREATTLLRDFAGGALGLLTDTGRLAVFSSLGVPIARPRLDEIVAATRLWRAVDAVGLDSDLPPGLGEADFEILARRREAPVIISGPGSSTDKEVRNAFRLVEKILGPGASS